jgi:hypothetical protein
VYKKSPTVKATNMFKEISWQLYGTCLIIAVIGYYLVIGWLYFRKERTRLFAKKQTNNHDEEVTQAERQFNETIKQQPSEITLSENSFLVAFNELEKIINDIRYELLPKAGPHADKAQLITLLKSSLKNYQGLTVPAFRMTVNSYIIREAAAQCDVSFTAQELETAWQTIIH